MKEQNQKRKKESRNIKQKKTCLKTLTLKEISKYLKNEIKIGNIKREQLWKCYKSKISNKRNKSISKFKKEKRRIILFLVLKMSINQKHRH